jgi:hypothetical protein
LIDHFEAEVGAGDAPGEYLVRVVRSAAGGEPAATFSLGVAGLLDQRPQLEETVLLSSVATRRVIPQAEQPLRQFGQQLFEALFSAAPVRGAYRASLGAVQGRGRSLRVVLRLTAPELAALPWEALFDPETETYLCLREPLVRHVPAPYSREPLEVVPPLRILGVVSSPRGLPALDVELEQHHLETALAGPIGDGLVALEWARAATWDVVHEALLGGPWHVLHFVGHGDYDSQRDEGLIAFVGNNSRMDLVEASRLADLLNQAQPTPRLVVLNSCSSGGSGSTDLFSGTAAALVRSGIDAVAAMQFAISDGAAIAFSRGFYTAVAYGRMIDEAVQSGRIAILGGSSGTLEWVTPVLYVRGEATHLFTIAPKLRTSATEDPEYKLGESAFFAGRWEEAIAHFSAVQVHHPKDQKVTQRLEQARNQRDLAAWYEQACGAGERGNWDEAVAAFERISAVDRDYRDVIERLDRARWQRRCNDLIEDVRRLHAAQHWSAVLDAGRQLAALDPDAADPDGLVTEARRALTEAGRQHTRGKSITQPNKVQSRTWRPRKRIGVVIAVVLCAASIATGITWIAHQTHHISEPGHYVALTPQRILNTRIGLGAARTKVNMGETLRLSMNNAKPRLPSNASAVALDVGAVAPQVDGEIKAYRSGSAIPRVPSVIFTAKRNITGAAIVAIGEDQQVNLAVAASADGAGKLDNLDLTADLLGYFTNGPQSEPGRFQPITPTPIPVNAAVHVADLREMPRDGIAAVVLTVWTTPADAAGWLQAVGSSWGKNGVTILNFAPDESIANEVVLPLDDKGNVTLIPVNVDAEGQVRISASISGYFTAGIPHSAGGFQPVPPTQLLDTQRMGLPSVDTKILPLPVSGPISPSIRIVPAHGASAVVLLVTVTKPNNPGLVTVNADEGAGGTSNINYVAGQNITGLVIAPLTPDGKVNFHVVGRGTSTHLIVAILGYFTSGPA